MRAVRQSTLGTMLSSGTWGDEAVSDEFMSLWEDLAGREG